MRRILGMRIQIIPDQNYSERMDDEVAAWWRDSVKLHRYQSFDGTKIQSYYALNPDADKAVVIVHGFTEFAEKFAEVMYYFYGEGYSVFTLDQRGHGRSGRKVPDPNLVFVNSFGEYVEDLRYFIDTVVRREMPDAPLFLFGHSMGGCVSALFLEKYPDTFKAAVLTSPMLKMLFGTMPDFAVGTLAVVSQALNWKARPLSGAAAFSPEPDFENSCATSEPRYLYTLKQQTAHKAYQTSVPTYGWVVEAMKATEELQKNAAEVIIPVLICQAGLDTLVDNAGQDSFAEHAANARIVRFPKAKHEIYRSPAEELEGYYGEIFDFYSKNS